MFKIFIYHIALFISGSLAIGLYFFYKTSSLTGVAGLSTPALFTVAIVYIIALGIFCAVSLVLFLLTAYIKNKRNSKKQNTL